MHAVFLFQPWRLMFFNTFCRIICGIETVMVAIRATNDVDELFGVIQLVEGAFGCEELFIFSVKSLESLPKITWN